MGPWARSFLAAVIGNAERPELEVTELRIEPGLISARVEGEEVTLSAPLVPQRIWAAITRYAQGMGQLQDAVEGRFQSVHLEHLLEEDWGETLIPRSGAITRSGGGDVAAVAFAVADRIDESPGELLRWRGVEGTERVLSSADPWQGKPLDAVPGSRATARGVVLKRLGPSGIASVSGELSGALRAAYDAFASRL
jgi:hypothetical protein